jgi:hypothetical protein
VVRARPAAHEQSARPHLRSHVHTSGDGPCELDLSRLIRGPTSHSLATPAKSPIVYRTGNTIFLSTKITRAAAVSGSTSVTCILRATSLACTSICIAHSFDYDEDSDAADDTVFAVLAIVVEPYSLPAADPGYDTSP